MTTLLIILVVFAITIVALINLLSKALNSLKESDQFINILENHLDNYREYIIEQNGELPELI